MSDRKQWLTLAFLAALAAGPVFADTEITKDVVMSHLQGVGQLDVGAAVAPYADDATLILADKVYHGSDEIRGFFKTFFAEFSQADVSMETEALVFEGNTALTTWNAESPNNVYEFGADTFVVQYGKIVSHTMAARITPK
ncbi:nuclear transport factor 2 family protein [Defluviimonas salinarum]|uniref:Nuclear transport factor 2 family protein n=1 Tax=Defluviimonas salinarum TaxID=2992147 RepID=A0ABT3J560_9RHOB|nr:nuclear transport factor 2 family protein [Defluviimonas salinarum]MCW3782786.1 nuclear transport factor 2 family protein [Defluviimonas salinarum]